MKSKTQLNLKVILMLVFAVMATELSTLGQNVPEKKPTPTPERNRQIVALLNDARIAAPELAVDTFLKVVETKKVTDPVWRKEIIDEALRTIDEVQYAMGMRPGFGGRVEANNGLVGTEDYLRVYAHGANLDRLSFKGRVITLLLESEPERAKQMVFQMGGDLGLKPRTCADALTYSPESIYPVVIKVAQAVFNEKQIGEGQRALFVAPWIENIESPRQIYPALDIVKQFQGSASERQLLFNAATRAIDRNFKDDRSFTYTWEAIAARIGKITEGPTDPHKSDLLNAFRGMALKNLRGTRCKDNEVKQDDPLPDDIVAVNKVLTEKPITLEDISTAEYAGTPKLVNILKKSTAAAKFREEGIAVRDQKIIDNKSVKHDVNDIEWGGRINEFVDRVLTFEGTEGETESEMMFLKAAMIGSVMSGIDPGEVQKTVLRKHLRYLAGAKLQRTSFIDWRFWIADAERMAPAAFYEIAPEFPNNNLKVIVAAKKLLSTEPKVDPQPAKIQSSKPQTSAEPKP